MSTFSNSEDPDEMQGISSGSTLLFFKDKKKIQTKNTKVFF